MKRLILVLLLLAVPAKADEFKLITSQWLDWNSTTSLAATNAFSAFTTHVRLVTDADVYFAVAISGNDSVVTAEGATSHYLPADVPEVIRVDGNSTLVALGVEVNTLAQMSQAELLRTKGIGRKGMLDVMSVFSRREHPSECNGDLPHGPPPYEKTAKEKREARWDYTLALRDGGEDFISIGKMLGVSSVRARQIYVHAKVEHERKKKFAPCVWGPDTPIEALNLSIRALNCLRNEEIRTIGQLMIAKKTDLMRIPNFGRKTLIELKEVCGYVGIILDFDKEVSSRPQCLPIERMGVSARLANCLKDEGIESIDRLVCMTAKELMRIPNFGKTCLGELRSVFRYIYTEFEEER
jgi:DNA-directed RNA polymerase alpha subunit